MKLFRILWNNSWDESGTTYIVAANEIIAREVFNASVNGEIKKMSLIAEEIKGNLILDDLM